MANFKLNGIKYQRKNKSVWDEYREELERNGFVILKNIFPLDLVHKLQSAYDLAIEQNLKFYSSKNINLTPKEFGIIRQIYRFNEIFLDAIMNPNVTEFIDNVLDDKWIISQQNGSHLDYNNVDLDNIGLQVWHRDFVYRHLTTSKPLLINMLVPLDPFTRENGATNLIPGSHLHSEFPSDEFVQKNVQFAEAQPGDAIVLNGLTYHSAGQNKKAVKRRSFNTVFAIPAFSHQVAPFPDGTTKEFIAKYGNILTGGYPTQPSVTEFIKSKNK
jgi:ectoine hydroxylase-related dioxygenase (phytanoyl-CoA dioxygenase family)